MITIPKVIDGKLNPHVEGKVYSGRCPLCNKHNISIGDGETVTCACGRTLTATWEPHDYYGEVLHLEAGDVTDAD